MSCMILNHSMIKALAETLCAFYNIGLQHGMGAYENYGINMTSDFQRLFGAEDCTDRHGDADPVKVAAMLYRYNAEAYRGRYSDEPAANAPDFSKVPGSNLAKRAEYDAGHSSHVAAEWHYTLAALLDMYLYQIEEDPTDKTDFYKTMKHQAELVHSDIVSMDPRYPSWMKLPQLCGATFQ